ncbi:MAG: hypothetical protein KBD54_02240, partial [Candidatus Pacebacteria bacterium]|nr:hypothetical protein [Candidatus Paceibacterota bacterium]
MILKRIIFSILLLVIAIPARTYAAPLCSDGSVAPGGNICNCPSAASIGGSNFVPGNGSGLTRNSYAGLNFGGIAGSLVSCLNVAGAISGEIKSLCGDKCNKAKGNTPSTTTGGTTDSIPAKVAAVEQNTKEAKEDLAATTKREQCLNGAADALAKNALQKVADKTVNWVKTGFNGNPFYVRDTTSYLKSIENEKLHTYLNKYVQTSDPVFGNALRSVLKQQTTGYTDGFLNKAMNTPEGRAYQDFQSDFTQGGWNAFLNPNNNPVGAYFNAANELSYIINTAQQDVKDELQQGNGFLSMKKCVEYEPIIKTSRPRTCNGGTPEDELLPGTTCVPDQTTTSTP